MQQFYHDRNYLDKPENLHALINVISYYPFQEVADVFPSGQYHQALIFDMRAISRESTYYDNWRKLNTKEDIDEYKVSDHFFGTIVIMPNKEFIKNVIEMSSHGGELAHPVFDHAGNLRYPLTQEQN